jgi:hypothetical protein
LSERAANYRTTNKLRFECFNMDSKASAGKGTAGCHTPGVVVNKRSSPGQREEVREVEAALKKGFAEVTSENDAAMILAEVEEIAGKAKEGDIPNVPSGVQPGEQAAAIKAAAEGAVSKERPARRPRRNSSAGRSVSSRSPTRP